MQLLWVWDTVLLPKASNHLLDLGSAIVALSAQLSEQNGRSLLRLSGGGQREAYIRRSAIGAIKSDRR